MRHFSRRRTSSARHRVKATREWISERNATVRCLGEPRQCWAIVEREVRQRTVVFRPKDTTSGFDTVPDSRSENATDEPYKPRNHYVFKLVGALVVGILKDIEIQSTMTQTQYIQGSM